MELDELKDIWKDQRPEQVARDVQPLLGKRSNTPIAKMKRHLMIELIAVIVLYGFVIAYFIVKLESRYYSISVLYFVLASLFCVYYYKKSRLLKEMECMACEVKSNLSKQVSTLESYIRFYLWAGTAIIPIVLIFFYGFEYSFIQPGKEHFFYLPSETVSVAQSVGTLLLWLIPSTILFYFINKWYIRKLYGKHIDSLKEMLAQMEDDEPYS
ncbi:MAG TPA: hypothetical protein VLA46_13005 [Saprospiraceae bacterium]|nr:hypothetical protein [Saprospiraceae bacterium]